MVTLDPLAQALKPVAARLTEAFVFGALATGKGTDQGEIDLALVGDVDLFEVSPLLDKAEHELGRPVHASLWSRDEWATEGGVFQRALKSGPRIDLLCTLRLD